MPIHLDGPSQVYHVKRLFTRERKFLGAFFSIVLLSLPTVSAESINYASETPTQAAVRTINAVKSSGSLAALAENLDCSPGSANIAALPYPPAQKTPQLCRDFFISVITNPKEIARLLNVQPALQQLAKAKGQQMQTATQDPGIQAFYQAFAAQLSMLGDSLRRAEFTPVGEEGNGDLARVRMHSKMDGKDSEAIYKMRRVDNRWYLQGVTSPTK